MVEDQNNVVVKNRDIQHMIYNIRDKQVMIDSDLAMLYQVETKYLNRQKSRNEDRFPEDFCFQLTKEEYDILRCQNVTSKKESGSGGRRYLPYVFTEQGIVMLSTVFVEMRKIFLSNQEIFKRLDRVELKQLEADRKLEEVFNYIGANTEVKQNIFFNGQIYDAFSFIIGLIIKAKKEIILIDNYVDINTLNILCKKNKGVGIVILTGSKGTLSTKDIKIFNAQYPKLSLKFTTDFHDRFLIIDKTEVYHIGASIKDAGKKSFGITKIEDNYLIQSLLNKVI